MKKLIVIDGGKPLCGKITVSGMKNSALAIIFAALATKSVCTIENVPNISDVALAKEILQSLGAKTTDIDETTMEIDATHLDTTCAKYELVRKMRASYYIIGALLARCGEAKVGLPGGCDFGERPIDQHVKGFQKLGATIEETEEYVSANAENGLVANNIYFDIVSVGATINVMLAAVCAKGTTILENAAREPHVVDTANFLNSCGAEIFGAGTDTIKIKGVESLHGTTYAIIPDMIEAGTFMVAAAATRGDLVVENIIPKHLETITSKLLEMGVDVTVESDESVRVRHSGDIIPANVKTMTYPGFPTDMHPQMSTLLSLASGESVVTENIWDNRFRYVEELKRMGAKITVEGNTAKIEGVPYLEGTQVRAVDLRAGAAMVIAGLAAKGRTEIDDVKYIERGYDDIVAKLRAVGADIYIATIPEPTLLADV